MAREKSNKVKIENIQTRLDLLIGNYRESREEGIRLAHSEFSDLAILIGLIGAIIGGGEFVKDPTLLIVIPPLLASFAIYAIQKLRISSLITSYLLYLEDEINKIMKEPIMVWNSGIVSRSVSAVRISKSGSFLLIFISILFTIFYSFAFLWVYMKNINIIFTNILTTSIYIIVCVILLVIAWGSLISTWRTILLYSPSRIQIVINDGYQKTISVKSVKRKSQNKL